MYKLHLWKATFKDGLPENGTETHNYVKKPTFEDMYKHIGCDMIEILHGYDKDISKRKAAIKGFDLLNRDEKIPAP